MQLQSALLSHNTLVSVETEISLTNNTQSRTAIPSLDERSPESETLTQPLAQSQINSGSEESPSQALQTQTLHSSSQPVYSVSYIDSYLWSFGSAPVAFDFVSLSGTITIVLGTDVANIFFFTFVFCFCDNLKDPYEISAGDSIAILGYHQREGDFSATVIDASGCDVRAELEYTPAKLLLNIEAVVYY